MANVYVVQGLGLGDDEDSWENIHAFTQRAKATAFIAQFKRDTPGCRLRIEEVELD